MSVDQRWPTDGTVTLRPLTPEDLGGFQPGQREELSRWLNSGVGSAETVHQHVARGVEQWVSGGPNFRFAIITVADQTLVGTIDVQLDQPFLTGGQANLAYLLYPLSRGHGFATRAVRLAVDFLRRHTDIREALILTGTENPASAGVAQRAGFHPAGQGDDGQHVLNRHLLTIR
ncbi:MAG TPA: GNAT family N-acetyltransferase [Pseudonocardiaceae bacterium]|nr:GNAT family N-acetyltransferase [Pseudonocardiaceae bacterium]